MAATDETLEEKIDAIENDDPVKEIFELMLKRIKELEEKVQAPPIRQGKK